MTLPPASANRSSILALTSGGPPQPQSSPKVMVPSATSEIRTPVLPKSLYLTRFPSLLWIGNDHLPYFRVNPASTGKVTPVTYLASSEARNTTALEMSADSTHGTGSALVALEASANCSGVGFSTPGRKSRYVGTLWIMSVFTLVGCTVLTRMKCGASSSASVRIRPTTPCLADT